MVGLLIITHNKVGEALLDAALSVIGQCPLPYKTLTVSQNCDPEERLKIARGYVAEINQGDGVLVLTDIYGSTPSNIACALKDNDISIIAGINLPMLVRIMNYAALPLEELTEKAISGGKNGVILTSNY